MTSKGATLHVLGADVLGGCESLSLSLARELARTGDESQEVVFLSPLTGLVSADFERAGVRVHSRPRRGRLRFMAEFADLCRERRVSSVLTHGFGQHVYTAIAAARATGCSTYPLVGNPAPRKAADRLRTMVYAQLARPFVRRHIACSRYVADTMVRAYKIPTAEIEVLPNWCDVEDVREKAEAARSSRATPDGPVIGMVARLDPIKDHETVIRAFAQFKAEVPGASMRIIGDGPLRGRLEALVRALDVSGSVQFLGSRKDVPLQLGLLDVFCFATTAQEGFGIVLIEAMAAGVPVVCTDIGPCREVLRNGEAGVLVGARDPLAMARGLEALWADPGRRAALAASAAAAANDHYSTRAAAVRMRQILAR